MQGRLVIDRFLAPLETEREELVARVINASLVEGYCLVYLNMEDSEAFLSPVHTRRFLRRNLVNFIPKDANFVGNFLSFLVTANSVSTLSSLIIDLLKTNILFVIILNAEAREEKFDWEGVYKQDYVSVANHLREGEIALLRANALSQDVFELGIIRRLELR
jgi:hypothetical protein